MNDQAKVQACWKTLGPLERQAKQILMEWRKYSRQVDRLNELQQTAGAACARGAYRQEDGEPHWAVVQRINDLRSEQTGICHRAAAVLLDLEDVLPFDKIESFEREIGSGSVRRICQGIVMMSQVLNEHCGQAPAGWSEAADGGAGVLIDHAVIERLEAQGRAMEIHFREIDAAEQKRYQSEQAEAKRTADDQKLSVIELALKLQDEGTPPDELRMRVLTRMRSENPNATPAEYLTNGGETVSAES